MSLTVVLGSLFTAVTMFLSSTADVFLGLPVQGLLLSTPVVWLYWLWPMFVQWLSLSFHLLSASQLLVFHT